MSKEIVAKQIKELKTKGYTIKEEDGFLKMYIEPVLAIKAYKATYEKKEFKDVYLLTTILYSTAAEDYEAPGTIVYLNPEISNEQIEEDGRNIVKLFRELAFDNKLSPECAGMICEP